MSLIIGVGPGRRIRAFISHSLITLKVLFLEGNGKLKMSDGSIIISQYHHSSNTGLRRKWNPDGKLMSIGYRYRHAPVGHCW
jgi:hypothetical protein